MIGIRRVLVYSEYWLSRGGGEKYLLCCVEAMLHSRLYDVTIVTQTASFDRDAVSRYFGVNVDGVHVEFVDGDITALREKGEAMSRDFDICMYMTNYRFFNAQARQTYAILQVPYGRINLLTMAMRSVRGELKEAAKDLHRYRLLKKLRETHAVIVYSKFVHDALDQIHAIPSTVLEPAIDDFLMEGTPKERVILSVGRIFKGLYNDKRYDVLISTFKQFYSRLPNTTWQYRIVGSCGSDEASQDYFEELRNSARGLPIYFDINTSYEDLKRHYNEATIFWHAAGFGVDETRSPQHAEHFGMSTLEAMSARCVPAVINRGGQKEIVSDGDSGYLCNSIDELVERSINLISDAGLLARLQTQARARFRDFDREHFSNKLLSILQS